MKIAFSCQKQDKKNQGIHYKQFFFTKFAPNLCPQKQNTTVAPLLIIVNFLLLLIGFST